MTAQERKWRAEEDASTMARYEEIMSDRTRRAAAVKAAQARASELQKRATMMQRVGGTKAKK